MARMKRMLAWKDNIELRAKEMQEWREKATQAKVDFEHHEDEHVQWIKSFENSRKLLIELIEFVQNGNRSLQLRVKQMLQQLIAEGQSTSSTNAHSSESSSTANMTIREMVLELDRREKEACAKANTLAKDPSKRVLHITQAVQQQIASKIVKVKSEAMIVDGEDEPKVDSEVEQLIKLLEDAHEAVLRAEAFEGDVEFLFQHDNKDHLRFDENAISMSNVITNSNGQNSTLSLVQQVLLQQQPSSVKNEQLDTDENQTAEGVYNSLLQQPTKKVYDVVNQMFESLDTATLARGNNGSSGRRRRYGATEPAINLSTFPRSRTERGQILMFSPLSQFEDRYFGTLPQETLFRPVGTTSWKQQFTHILPQMISSGHLKAENDEIERYSLHSDSLYTQREIERLTQSITELQRLLAESDRSYQRTQSIYQQVLHEDVAEHGCMMQYLSEQGLLNGELHANESFITTAAAAQLLESKPSATFAPVTSSATNGPKKGVSATVPIATASAKEKKNVASRSNATTDSATSSTAKTAAAGKKASSAVAVSSVKATDKNSSNSGGLFASAAAAIGNAFGVNVAGNKRTEVTGGSNAAAPATKRRK